ncbi:hypothetical protein CR513_56484, partial [Mucuna pruriens]
MVSAPTLQLPDFSKISAIECGASGYGIRDVRSHFAQPGKENKLVDALSRMVEEGGVVSFDKTNIVECSQVATRGSN